MKKNERKIILKSTKAITLIALVVTIIVLLILAGISISMLSGNNGLLNRTTEARERTIHAHVFEQLQIEELAHLTDTSTLRDTSTLIGYLQSKSIIGDEIGEDTGKYQVNVTALLGSRQSLGNGDATVELKDVYMLEKQNVSSGSIVNTKVATTQPIRIAATSTTQITYKVMYYGNGTSENLTLGSLKDNNDFSSIPVEEDPFTLRYEYGYLWADCNDWKKNIDEKNETTLINIFENYLKIMEKEYKNMGATDEQIENELNNARNVFQNKNIDEKKDIITELVSTMSITSCLYNDTESIKQNKGHEFSWKVEKPGKYTVNYLNLEKSSENIQKSIDINTLDDYIIDRIVCQTYSGEIYIDVLHFNNGSYDEITPDKIIMKINNEEVVNGTEIVGEQGDRVYTISKDFDEKYTTYEGEIIAFIGERQVTYKGPIYVSGGE